MEAYVLVLLGNGLKTECIDGNYFHDLNQGWSLVADELLRTESSNNDKTSKTINNKDPLVSLLQRKRLLHFAVCCSSSSKKLFPEELSNTSEWLFVSENKEQLNNFSKKLEIKPKRSIKFENEDDGSSEGESDEERDGSDSETDFIANHIHQLTDLLPNKGEAVVQIHWILPDSNNLNISNTLALFGALKRLQECNNAFINIISSDTKQQSFLSTWSELLQFSVCSLNSSKHFNLPIWNGSLRYMGNEDGKLFHLPNFALTWQEENGRHLYLHLDEEMDVLPSSDPSVMHFSGIQLLYFTSRNSIPLFLFLPYKLKLYLLCENAYESKMFIQKLKSFCSKGLCLLACLTLNRKSGNINSTTFESWIESTLSSTEKQLTKDHCTKPDTMDVAVQRLCVIDCDSDGNVCFYPLRQTEDISGDLYEYLDNMTRGKQIVENLDKDCLLSLQDFSESLHQEQQEMSLLESQHIANEIAERSKCGNSVQLTNEVLGKIMLTLDMKHCPLKSSYGPLENMVHLDLSHALFNEKLPSTESKSSPSLWQERLWLLQKDPQSLNKGRPKMPLVGLQEVLSLSAKDILKCFRPDGMALKTDLSPLKPVNKSVKDNYININTNEVTIQETFYPESLIKKFHGVEYCLDSCSSLSKDAQLSQTQTSVLKQETLSLSSELVPRTFPKKNKEQPVGKKKTSQNRDGKEKPIQQSRSLKRKSPRQTTKPVKRKRNISPENKKEESSISENSETAAKARESRSQRHKRRLRLVVDKTLGDKGIGTDHALYSSCSERLYTLIKSFLKDLKSSHGLNETMKELAHSNVDQVVNFEKTRLKLQAKKRASHSKTKTQ